MVNYKIEVDENILSIQEKEILIIFLQMLDFSAEYLTEKYQSEKIKFYPEKREIIILAKENEELIKIRQLANSYRFNLKFCEVGIDD